MRAFKDLNIKTETEGFTGDKIKMQRVLDKDIVVLKYRIVTSQYPDKGNGKCLHLQIKMNETIYVVFTGSIGLMDAIIQVKDEDLPFTTKITKPNERFQFN